MKSQNKWWDGYNNQDVVLIDDFDKMGTGLSHYLKIWADPYGDIDGEIKGSTIPLNFKELYITSNYTIEELFWSEQDQQLSSALLRRFEVLNFDVFPPNFVI